TWYTWIEQGREVSVSPSVWARIAGVLQLARAERAYLFELAECADPQHPRDDSTEAPGLLRECVDAITAPAYVLDRAWNVLVHNDAMRELFDDWPVRDPRPNLLRYIFLDPAARQLVVDWDQRARRVVAEFRADAGAHLDETDVLALLDELNRDSDVFAHWWTRHAVVEREGGVREFQHPRLGRLAYRQTTFRLATHPDLRLVMLLDGAGTIDRAWRAGAGTPSVETSALPPGSANQGGSSVGQARFQQPVEQLAYRRGQGHAGQVRRARPALRWP